MEQGLYIHIPFCLSKCNYCDFYSVAPGDSRDKDEFLTALSIEMDGLPDDFQPGSVYIGGGTPSVMSVKELDRLFTIIMEHVDLSEVSEFSMEANPGTLTEEKVERVKSKGVDRISLGAQSFDSSVLELLGRSHTVEDVGETWQMLVDAGIKNRSLDLMYAIPSTSLEGVRADCAQAMAMEPEHIAAYALSIEEGTPLHFQYESGMVQVVDDGMARDQYHLVRELLAEKGYRHYEISNFSKAGFECRHNYLYWSGGEYIGCGPSAHSHWQGVRSSNTANLWQYSRMLTTGESPVAMEDRLSGEEKARETLVLSLRWIDGVDMNEFESKTGFDLFKLRGPEIENLIADGLLESVGNRLRLTEKALFISDTVFRELV